MGALSIYQNCLQQVAVTDQHTCYELCMYLVTLADPVRGSDQEVMDDPVVELSPQPQATAGRKRPRMNLQ